MSEYWLYGMKERGFGPGCQPKEGLAYLATGQRVAVILAGGRKYWDVIAYGKELSSREIVDYELEFIGKTEKEEV